MAPLLYMVSGPRRVRKGSLLIQPESRAVGRYIASKHRNQGAQLLPRDDDVEAQALFEQWASIEYSLFYVRAEKVLVHKWFNP